jgi:hypothetical protein
MLAMTSCRTGSIPSHTVACCVERKGRSEQQEWINSGNFMSLGEERDPSIGLQADGATFTIPQESVRRRVHGIQTFNVLRGGEYLFMPSLSALHWLTALDES